MSARPIPDIFTSLDLELNQKESGPKIIQIGAVVGSLRTGEILEYLSVIVNPHEQLLPFITQLTGITQSQVDCAPDLPLAMNLLTQLHKSHGSFCNPIVWGNGDVRALMTELSSIGVHNVDPALFGRRELDAKTLYVGYRLGNGMFPAGGLAKAMNTIGLKFKGRKHDALCDAENTFQIYRKLISYFKGSEKA